jgi:hypothetical protein
MKSIKSADIGRKKKDTSKRIFTISLTLALITLVASTTSISSLQFIGTAMAASLTGVRVVPASNIVNERSTYDISFKTKTTGSIKTIVIDFPFSFTINIADLLERSGIGSGSLSASGTELKYTINNAVSVPAGTPIRLEIGKIIATTPSSGFTITIRTLNTADGTIDGPTNSGIFTVKSISGRDIADNSITGNDISSEFMIRKTLHDDAIGNAHGWNPDTGTRAFAISDSDISGSSSSEFVSVMVRSGNPTFCAAASGDTGLFGVYCDSPPGNSAELDYIITKLPAHDDVASSISGSTSESTPSSASPSLSSSSHKSALPDIESFNRRDDSASEFP